MSEEPKTYPLPCPFCGEVDTVTGYEFLRANVDGVYSWHVFCRGCRTNFGEFGTEEEAIAAWNKRAERTCRDVCASISEFICSECGFNCDLTSWISLFDGDTGKHRHHHHGTPNYCPNCGAKVVEE